MCAVCEVRDATYDGRFCSSLCGWASVFGGKVLEGRKRKCRPRCGTSARSVVADGGALGDLGARQELAEVFLQEVSSEKCAVGQVGASRGERCP